MTSSTIRVDVMSVKGGVGKSTLAYLLARAQAETSKLPVLIIDADLTGTCLGDLLDHQVSPAWASTMNLAHLLSDPPEALLDTLQPATLPVYLHDPASPSGNAAVRPDRSCGARIVYCPSHGDSTLPTAVDRPILEALLAHETAGGWIRHVIEQVISATVTAIGPLGGVLVDHAPGMGILQTCMLGDDNPQRRNLSITTCDHVDLQMAAATHARMHAPGSPNRTTWAINRVPPAWVPGPDFNGVPWVSDATQVPDNEALRIAYRGSSLGGHTPDSPITTTIATLRAALFGPHV